MTKQGVGGTASFDFLTGSYDSGRPSPIVIDNGSCFLKAGLADAANPTFVAENAWGVIRRGDRAGKLFDYLGGGTQEYLEADDAISAMSAGVVVDWELMSKTWDHVINRELFQPDSVAGIHRPYPQVSFTHGIGEALDATTRNDMSNRISHSLICCTL